eukprot:8445216-Pyramimonas_sp.AAC.1
MSRAPSDKAAKWRGWYPPMSMVWVLKERARRRISSTDGALGMRRPGHLSGASFLVGCASHAADQRSTWEVKAAVGHAVGCSSSQ